MDKKHVAIHKGKVRLIIQNEENSMVDFFTGNIIDLGDESFIIKDKFDQDISITYKSVISIKPIR